MDVHQLTVMTSHSTMASQVLLSTLETCYSGFLGCIDFVCTEWSCTLIFHPKKKYFIFVDVVL